MNLTQRPGVASPSRSGIAEVFRAHHLELVRLATLLVGDRPTAEDVVQDVFMRLHARPDGVTNAGAPLAYVRAAVVNGCRSVQRRRKIARRRDASEAGARQETEVSAESAVLLAEDRRQVLAALAGLPRRRREVLVLRYYLGLSEAEIASVLGVSAGTVKSTAARGLAALAGKLGEEQ